MKIRMRREFNGLRAGKTYDVSDSDGATLCAARVCDVVEDDAKRSHGDTVHGRVPDTVHRDSYEVIH